MKSQKNIEITHANYSATSKVILTKMLVQPECLYFYLRFALGIIHGDGCDRKTPKIIVLFKSNPFLVVEFRNTVTF